MSAYGYPLFLLRTAMWTRRIVQRSRFDDGQVDKNTKRNRDKDAQKSLSQLLCFLHYKLNEIHLLIHEGKPSITGYIHTIAAINGGLLIGKSSPTDANGHLTRAYILAALRFKCHSNLIARYMLRRAVATGDTKTCYLLNSFGRRFFLKPHEMWTFKRVRPQVWFPFIDIKAVTDPVAFVAQDYRRYLVKKCILTIMNPKNGLGHKDKDRSVALR